MLFLSDPFADATKGDDRLPAGTEDYIHIRIQQRNGRKTLTTVQGISADYDKKKLVKAFKKVNVLLFPLQPGSGLDQNRSDQNRAAVWFHPSVCLWSHLTAHASDLLLIVEQKFACNGTVIEHPEYGEVIQLQGDQRKNICQFLIEVRLSSRLRSAPR